MPKMNGSGDQCSERGLTSIFNFLYSLYCQEKSCDLCLISEDSEKFYVHGFVAASQIPKIRKIIVGPSEHIYRSNHPLHLTKINSRELRLALDFAYLGDCDVPLEASATLQLLKVASWLELKPLMVKCMNSLSHNIDMNTALNILSTNKFSVDFIHEAHKVAEDLALRQLITSRYLTIDIDTLEFLLRDPRLHAPYEEDVVLFVFQWILHNLTERRNTLPNLLSLLRLGLLAPGSLDVIASFPLVAQNESAVTVIEVAHAVTRCFRRNKMVKRRELVPLPLRPRIPYDIPLIIGGWMDKIGACDLVDAYDHLAYKWAQVPWMTLPQLRVYHGTEVLDNYIYIIGGYSGTTSSNLNTCMRLCIDSTAADNETHRGWEYVASMKYNRCFIATTVLGGKIYVVGGRDGDLRHVMAERYDPATNMWTLLPSLPAAVSDTAVTTLNGKLYVAGGYNGVQLYDTAIAFDPLKNKWSTLPPLNKARSGLKLVTLHDCLYAIGGYDGKTRCEIVERYEPGSPMNEWQPVASMLTGRSNFGALILHGRLLVFGGYTNTGITNLCETYDPQENKWYPLAPLSVPRSGMSCCLLEDSLATSQQIFNSTQNDQYCPYFVHANLPRPRYHALAAVLTPLPDPDHEEALD